MPAVGVTVQAFVCADRRTCLTALAYPVGAAVTDAAGHFSISIPSDQVLGKLVRLVATVDGIKIRALVTPRRVHVGSGLQLAPGSAADETTDIEVDAISEAAVRLLDDQGLENYSDDGVDAVIAAVQTANAAATFDGLGVQEAADHAESTAASNAAVQTALQSNRMTPTPTATPTSTPVICVGACHGGHAVAVDDLITMASIALGQVPVSACDAGDANHDNQITIEEILTAVNNALTSCPG